MAKSLQNAIKDLAIQGKPTPESRAWNSALDSVLALFDEYRGDAKFSNVEHLIKAASIRISDLHVLIDAAEEEYDVMRLMVVEDNTFDTDDEIWTALMGKDDEE